MKFRFFFSCPKVRIWPDQYCFKSRYVFSAKYPHVLLPSSHPTKKRPFAAAALDPIFTLHGLLCTTCFSGPIIIVNGPIAEKIGMNWGINALGGLVVEIEAQDGTTGVGVTIGGEAGAQIVERHLARFVEGRDPRDVESIWDQMFRATLNYGRKGLAVHRVKLRFGLPHAIDATSSP